MRLPSENAFTERKCRSQRRKRDNRMKAWLGKAKTPLESENVARKGENAFIER